MIPMNNPMQLMQQIQQFSRTVQGNPQQMIQQALQSGRLSQQQLNEAQRMATQIQSMLQGMK